MKFGKIYVLCPPNNVGGGADALHQMVYYLNKIGLDAKIVYKGSLCEYGFVCIPDRFKIYCDDFLLEKDIVDDSNNVIIASEYFTTIRHKFKKTQIFIWWLGINSSLTWTVYKKTFYLIKCPLHIIKSIFSNEKISGKKIVDLLKETVKNIVNILNLEAYPLGKERWKINHLCASYYAYDYVSKRSCNKVLLCIEPISKLFLDKYAQEKNISKEKRKNIILYNPLRKYTDIITKISLAAPDFQFEPLHGLNQQQLIDKYKTSKLYVDFGAFPGAERIPKEAVLYGCAIITGKRGTSGFHGDVPIPEEYKFGNPENQIEKIVEKIRFVLNNYEIVYSDFNEYRNTVLNLEENFIKSLKKIFL